MRIGWVWFCCALLSALRLAAAGNQIAVVDLEKVFREYYKSRIAEETIRGQSETYRSYMLQLDEQRRKLLDEARTARLNAQNIALSPGERSKAEAEAGKLEAAVREKSSEIELYAESRAEAMRDLERRKRAEIMEDIRAGVRRRAAAEGYLYVLDSSGKTMNEQPAVLLFPDSCDLTAVVIEDLNRTASSPRRSEGEVPAEATKPGVKP